MISTATFLLLLLAELSFQFISIPSAPLLYSTEMISIGEGSVVKGDVVSPGGITMIAGSVAFRLWSGSDIKLGPHVQVYEVYTTHPQRDVINPSAIIQHGVTPLRVGPQHKELAKTLIGPVRPGKTHVRVTEGKRLHIYPKDAHRYGGIKVETGGYVEFEYFDGEYEIQLMQVDSGGVVNFNGNVIIARVGFQFFQESVLDTHGGVTLMTWGDIRLGNPDYENIEYMLHLVAHGQIQLGDGPGMHHFKIVGRMECEGSMIVTSGLTIEPLPRVPHKKHHETTPEPTEAPEFPTDAPEIPTKPPKKPKHHEKEPKHHEKPTESPKHHGKKPSDKHHKKKPTHEPERISKILSSKNRSKYSIFRQ